MFIGERNTHSGLWVMGPIGNLDMCCGQRPQEKGNNNPFLCVMFNSCITTGGLWSGFLLVQVKVGQGALAIQWYQRYC